MHDIIRQMEIPAQPRTGVAEERELFAKLEADERIQRRKARRARMLELLGWRRPAAETSDAPRRTR